MKQKSVFHQYVLPNYTFDVYHEGMEQLMTAVALYITVFGIDYLFYVKLKNLYSYVSLRTHMLFILGQIIAFWLFYDVYRPFIQIWQTEVTLLLIFVTFLFVFAYMLIQDKLYVCSMNSRTLRCLTPYYVLVKGAEIVFQQMIYVVIAFSLTSLLGVNFLTYVAYVFILLIAHIIVILGGKQSVVKSLTFGLFAISVPIFYIYTEMNLFWPAVYLHGIMYVFYWITFTDFDGQQAKKAEKVENSG